jgi:hypothetical protein
MNDIESHRSRAEGRASRGNATPKQAIASATEMSPRTLRETRHFGPTVAKGLRRKDFPYTRLRERYRGNEASGFSQTTRSGIESRK